MRELPLTPFCKRKRQPKWDAMLPRHAGSPMLAHNICMCWGAPPATASIPEPCPVDSPAPAWHAPLHPLHTPFPSSQHAAYSLQHLTYSPLYSPFTAQVAILAGDFLLARASVSLASLRNNEVVMLMSQVLENLVAGEILQVGPGEVQNIPGCLRIYVDLLDLGIHPFRILFNLHAQMTVNPETQSAWSARSADPIRT